MGKTIFRMRNGRVVPMVVDDEIVGDDSQSVYIKTPKHKHTMRQLSDKDSFAIPNAVCMSCGKGVYYYENSYGSRVLFDSLGPPWPIHPCYSNQIENKKGPSSIIETGWEPVIIDRAVITSSGGLRIQGLLGDLCIRIFFEEKIFSRMKISIDDAKNLIAYGSHEKGLIQTHNGKKIFTTKYEKIKKTNTISTSSERIDSLGLDSLSRKVFSYTAQKKILNDDFVMLEIYFGADLKSQMIFKTDSFNKYFKGMIAFRLERTRQLNEIVFSCRSDIKGMFIMLNSLAIGVNHLDKDIRREEIRNSSENNMHFVGVFQASEIRYLDDSNDKVLLRGMLNRRFKANYLVDDPILATAIYQYYGSEDGSLKNQSFIVMDNEQHIELKISNDNFEPFRVRFIVDKVILKWSTKTGHHFRVFPVSVFRFVWW